MTVAQIAKRLLLFADQRTLTEATASGQEYVDAAIDAINAALQEIYDEVPATLATRQYGLTTRFPIPLTTQIAQHEKVAYFSEIAPDWTLDQTIVIGAHAARMQTLIAGLIPTGPTYLLEAAGDGAAPTGLRFFDTGKLSSGHRIFRSEITAASEVGFFLATEDTPGVYKMWSMSRLLYSGQPITYEWQYLAMSEPTVDTITELDEPERDMENSSASAALLSSFFPLPSTTEIATIYNDAIALPPEIVQIYNDVTADGFPLRSASSPQDLRQLCFRPSRADYGRIPLPGSLPFPPTYAGTPTSYMVAPISEAYMTKGLAMRLFPLPNQVYSITFTAKVRPQQVTAAMLDAAHDGAGCTVSPVVPHGWDETFLLPIATYHFSTMPFWKDAEKAAAAKANYTRALDKLRYASPQRSRPIRFVASF